MNLLHKYYDWQLIESLPLTALDELLSFAISEERRREKIDLEKQLFPLWIANYALAKLQGNDEIMDFEAFVSQTLEPEAPCKEKHQRTAEDILADIMPIVEADRKRGG